MGGGGEEGDRCVNWIFETLHQENVFRQIRSIFGIEMKTEEFPGKNTRDPKKKKTQCTPQLTITISLQPLPMQRLHHLWPSQTS